MKKIAHNNNNSNKKMAHLEKETHELKQRLAHLEREARCRGWGAFPHSPFVHTPEGEQWNKHLFHRVEEMELSLRSEYCLQNACIDYIFQLVQKTEQDLLKIKNFGRKSLNEIKTVLAEKNLSLGMTIKDFPVHLVQRGGSQ
jgi:DNA-directed RNA polymerase alpha subunit